VRPLTNLASSLLLQVSITVAGAAFLFGEDIMAALYKFGDVDQLRLSASVFGNILLAFIPMSLTFVFSTLLTAKRDLKYLNIFALCALFCNISLNLLLIPKYGSFGASVSSLVTQSVFALLSVWRCFYLFKFKIQLSNALRYLAFIVILTGVFTFIKGIDNIWLTLAIYAISALVLVFSLKLIEVRQILNTFKLSKQ
jgi:O-antigen/teichoic acid export membrane protein